MNSLDDVIKNLQVIYVATHGYSFPVTGKIAYVFVRYIAIEISNKWSFFCLHLHIPAYLPVWIV